MLTPETAFRKDRTMPAGREVMQHRHFAVIADMIRNYPGNEAIRVAEHFARELAATNSRFDRARFLRACMAEEV